MANGMNSKTIENYCEKPLKICTKNEVKYLFSFQRILWRNDSQPQQRKAFAFLDLCASIVIVFVIHTNSSYHQVNKIMKYVDLNIYSRLSINVKE